MKTRKIISFLFIISLIFVLGSCSNVGGSAAGVSTPIKNSEGKLVKKLYSNYDVKFGYETMVNTDTTELSMSLVRVYIPEKTWARIPELNDSTIVHIEYVEEIEYGDKSDDVAIWDNEFNLCTGFTVEKIAKK